MTIDNDDNFHHDDGYGDEDGAVIERYPRPPYKQIYGNEYSAFIQINSFL